MMNIFFNEILKELEKCKKSEDVPVSALLINNENKIVARSFNTRQKKYNFCNHAEINVINNIYKKKKTKNLKEYKLIVSLKPCLMCISIIEQANINIVYYYLENIKCDYTKYKTKILFYKIEDEAQEEILKKRLKNFFIKLRK